MAKPASAKVQKTNRKDMFRLQRRKQQQRERIVMISVVGVIALTIAAVLIIPNLPVDVGNYTQPQLIDRPLSDGMTLGSPDAPVKVEEFSDFKCVHCADFWENQEPELLADYINAGKVYFKYVPMSFLSSESNTAAEAAYCANDQGKFWEYHDYIFANFGASLTDPLLRAFARDLDLDMELFDQCFDRGRYRQQVLDDLAYAKGKGVTATPTFDVNGILVNRGELIAKINELLGQ